ncbi:hypothetical protein [Planctomycetes bacterium Pan216]
MTQKRLFPLLFLLLGFVGGAICLVMTIGVGVGTGIVVGEVASVTGTIDDLLDAAAQGVEGVGKRLGSLKSLADEFEQRTLDPHARTTKSPDVENRLLREIADRVADRIASLEGALGVAQAGAGVIEKALRGGRVPAGLISSEQASRLLDAVQSVEAQVKRAISQADKIRARFEGVAEGELPADRLKQLATLAGQLRETLGTLTSAVDGLGAEITTVRGEVGNLRARIDWWLMIAAFVLVSFLVWMALGQASLMVAGWRGWWTS